MNSVPAAQSHRAPHTTTARPDIPLAAYVHLPWCVHKCPYCDFNSHRAPSKLPERAYVDALVADWALATAGESRPIETVFIGGGTPSLFSAASVGEILETMDATLGLASDCEITLEVNPGTSERGAFADWRAAGVNRVSIGVQSLSDYHLGRLGRIHAAASGRAALADARAAGFTRINCDLMFGLPDQSVVEAEADLNALLALAPSHVSYYQLTFEPGTPFHYRPPARAGDDTLATMAESGAARLARNGLARYEVSAFAAPGEFCRHNDHVWRFGDYIGIGAGAHGKRTDASGRIERTARLHWPRGYQMAAGSPRAIAETRPLDANDRWFECLLGALRRTDGIARGDFEQRTGLPWAELLASCRPAIDDGLLVADDEAMTTTSLGWQHLDTVLERLVP